MKIILRAIGWAAAFAAVLIACYGKGGELYFADSITPDSALRFAQSY
jgi:hypothetical protein